MREEIKKLTEISASTGEIGLIIIEKEAERQKMLKIWNW